MKVKTIVQVVLAIAALGLAYLIYDSIMEPVRFTKARSAREAVIIKRLKEIRETEAAFRSINHRFTGSMDTLIAFLESGRLPTVKKTGIIPDTLTEAEALKLKIITRDTVYANAYDVLFPGRSAADKATHLKLFRYVPTTNMTKEFEIETAYISRSNLSLSVVEVRVPYEAYLGDDNYRQLLSNLVKMATDLNRYPGLKFGSLKDPITEGNWE